MLKVLHPMNIGEFHQISRAFCFFLILMSVAMHWKSHHWLLSYHGHSEMGELYGTHANHRSSLHTQRLNTSGQRESQRNNSSHRASP